MLDTIFLIPLAAAAIFLAVGNTGRRAALLSLPAISLLCIWLISPAALASLLLLVVPFFFLREAKDRRGLRGLPFWVGIGTAVTLFMTLKNYFGVGDILLSPLVEVLGPELGLLLGAVGLSFVIFRVVEYLLVVRVAEPDLPLSGTLVGRLWIYLGFCLAFCTVTSGPILRWRGFYKDMASRAPVFADRHDMMTTLHRLANGMVKISLLSQPLLLIVLASNQMLGELDELELRHQFFIAIMAVFYLHFLYLNFLAFSDVMIASGRLVGLTVPENFDRPFSTYGFLDFFNHWHLSVSQWFRDVIFTPLVRSLIMRGWRSNTVISMLAFLITFSLLGLWHGRTWPFLLCGLMLGFGATVNQLYRDVGQKRVVSAMGKQSMRLAVLRQWLRAMNYVYIALAIMGLWLSAGPLADFWLASLQLEFVAGLVGLISAYAVIIVVSIAACQRLGLERDRLAAWGRRGGLAGVVLKLILGILIFQLLAMDDGSSFVYEGF